MAGQAGGEFKFLKKIFLVGFGAFAAALFLQRKELNKYGYDLYTRETALQVADLTTLNIAAPANQNDGELKKILDKWEQDGISHQVYLSRATIIPAGQARAGEPNINPADVKDTPMLVKCDDGSIWAYVNDKRAGGNGAVIAQRIPQNDPARWNLYKGLHFPADGIMFSPDREKRSTRAVKNITNVDIVKDLQTNAHHLHVSKNHAHKDSRMDNRFLILKNEVHIPAVAANPAAVPPIAAVDAVNIGPDYYVYAQDRNGVYHLRQVTADMRAELEAEGVEFAKDKHTQIKRNQSISGKVLAQATALGAAIDAANPRFTQDQLAELSQAQRQKTLFFTGGVAAVQAVEMLPQLISTAQYSVMNKMHGGGSLKHKVAEQLKPVRTSFDI